MPINDQLVVHSRRKVDCITKLDYSLKADVTFVFENYISSYILGKGSYFLCLFSSSGSHHYLYLLKRWAHQVIPPYSRTWCRSFFFFFWKSANVNVWGHNFSACHQVWTAIIGRVYWNVPVSWSCLIQSLSATFIHIMEGQPILSSYPFDSFPMSADNSSRG